MKTHTQILVALVTLLVVGCAKEDSSQVSPSSIYTSYSANYNDALKKVSSQAIFNTGGPTGTYLILDDSSQIAFDGSDLSQTTDVFNQVIYNSSESYSSFNTANVAHTFVYTDSTGENYVNTFYFPALANPAYSTNSVSISSGTLTVSWASSDSLGADSLSLQLQGSAGFITQTISDGNSYEGNSGSTTMQPSDMKNWAPGTYSAQLCRTESVPTLNAPAEGGSLSVGSCSSTTQIVLLP
jgi:hypothetical protein